MTKHVPSESSHQLEGRNIRRVRSFTRGDHGGDMTRQPTDSLLGRTISRIRVLDDSEKLAIAHKGFKGVAILELDDGSLIAASRMTKPHGSSELLLVHPGGHNWETPQASDVE